MKRIVVMVLGVVLLFGVGFWALNTFIYNEKQADEPEAEGSVADYFQTEIATRAVADVGQPIEGFDAALLTLAYPGLVPSDFEGVEALEGVYVVKNNVAVFERTDTTQITSAEQTIATEGYPTLLQNLSDRLGIAATSTEAVDFILDTVDTGERVAVAIGETGRALGVSVTPLELLEDSRCPVDAECIQAGTVRVRVQVVSGMGTATEIMTLNEPLTTEAESVTLMQVAPTRESETIVDLQTYEFSFQILKR